LTPLNIQARYPAYREAIYSLIDKKKRRRLSKKRRSYFSGFPESSVMYFRFI
jgi:hypothetical protein